MASCCEEAVDAACTERGGGTEAEDPARVGETCGAPYSDGDGQYVGGMVAAAPTVLGAAGLCGKGVL